MTTAGGSNDAAPSSRRPADAGERVLLADLYQALHPEDHAHRHWERYLRWLEDQ